MMTLAILMAPILVALGASTAAAQSSIPRVGVLTAGLTYDPALEGLREGLAKLGFREDKNLKLIVEDSKGDMKSFAARAVKLTEAKPDVLVTVAAAPSVAAKHASQSIPIVFTVVGDPVHSQLVANFASSGCNLTGVTSHSTPLSGKRLELLKDLVPKAKAVLAIVSAKGITAQLSSRLLEEAGRKLGIQILRREVSSVDDIEKVLAETTAGKVDAIFHVPSVLVGNQMESIIAKAKKENLPLIVHEESLVKMGALAGYGADFRLLGAQAAQLVGKILKGAKPAEIPVETPDKLVLSINMATAKAIGLKVPRKVLERADRLVD